MNKNRLKDFFGNTGQSEPVKKESQVGPVQEELKEKIIFSVNKGEDVTLDFIVDQFKMQVDRFVDKFRETGKKGHLTAFCATPPASFNILNPEYIHSLNGNFMKYCGQVMAMSGQRQCIIAFEGMGEADKMRRLNRAWQDNPDCENDEECTMLVESGMKDSPEGEAIQKKFNLTHFAILIYLNVEPWNFKQLQELAETGRRPEGAPRFSLNAYLRIFDEDEWHDHDRLANATGIAVMTGVAKSTMTAAETCEYLKEQGLTKEELDDGWNPFTGEGGKYGGFSDN